MIKQGLIDLDDDNWWWEWNFLIIIGNRNDFNGMVRRHSHGGRTGVAEWRKRRSGREIKEGLPQGKPSSFLLTAMDLIYFGKCGIWISLWVLSVRDLAPDKTHKIQLISVWTLFVKMWSNVVAKVWERGQMASHWPMEQIGAVTTNGALTSKRNRCWAEGLGKPRWLQEIHS